MVWETWRFGAKRKNGDMAVSRFCKRNLVGDALSAHPALYCETPVNCRKRPVERLQSGRQSTKNTFAEGSS